MGLDFKPKTWFWQQWLATIAFVFYLIVAFTTPYTFMLKIRFKVTLMTFIITLVTIYNYGYIVGAFVEMDRKKYMIQLIAPPALILVELFFFFILRNAMKVNIYFLGYLKFLVAYGIMIGTFALCHLGVEYKYEYLTEEEVKELGVDG